MQVPDPSNTGTLITKTFPLTLFPARPGLVASVPDSFRMETDTKFTADGGYYGSGLAKLLFNGNPGVSIAPTTSRKFSQPLPGSSDSESRVVPGQRLEQCSEQSTAVSECHHERGGAVELRRFDDSAEHSAAYKRVDGHESCSQRYGVELYEGLCGDYGAGLQLDSVCRSEFGNTYHDDSAVYCGFESDTALVKPPPAWPSTVSWELPCREIRSPVAPTIWQWW